MIVEDKIFKKKFSVNKFSKKIIFTVKEFKGKRTINTNLDEFLSNTRYIPFSFWFIGSFYDWSLGFSKINCKNKYLSESNFRNFLSENTNIDLFVIDLLKFLEDHDNSEYLYIENKIQSKIIFFLLQYVWEFNLKKYTFRRGKNNY